jgi:hypothetical protein
MNKIKAEHKDELHRLLSACDVITIRMEINKSADKSKKLIQNFDWGPQRKIGVDIVQGMVNITVDCTNVKGT